MGVKLAVTMKLWRRVSRVAGYVVLVMVFVIGALEVCCRWGVLPNAAAARVSLARAKASHRVLVLGDSFSFEDPSEPEVFGRRLRQWLDGRGAAVVSLAAGGLGPFEYFESLEGFLQIASDYRPDLVLINYYVGNDVTDTVFRQRGRAPRVFRAEGFWAPLLRRSYLARLVVDRMEARHVSRRKAELREQMRTEGISGSIWNAVLFDACRRHPPFVDDNLLVASATAEQAWRENERLLGAIFDRARRMHSRVLLNIFPSTLQVNRSHAEQYQALGCRIDERAYEGREPQRRLLALCERTQVTCNDLLPAFRADRQRERYLPGDEHWNGEGNALAFSSVSAAIDGAGLLGP
jgi:hypothetical protein